MIMNGIAATTIGALGLSFAIAGNSGQKQQELTPEQKEYIAVTQICRNAVATALPGDHGTASKYLTEGCQMTYYAAKNLLTYAKK